MVKWIKSLFRRGFDPALKVLPDAFLASVWGAGSSGGGDGVTRYDWNPYMENMWAGGVDGNPGLLNRAVGTLNTPYSQYGGQRVAGINEDQNSAMGGIRYLAQNGSDVGDAGSRSVQQTLGGNYLGSNQWSNPETIGYNLEQANPAYNAAEVGAGTNQYMGENPYFTQQLNRGASKITDAYNKGTSADTRRAFNLSGAFGGSAHQAAQANNESALAQQLGDYTNSMLSGQYDRSANLREADINRQLGVEQFNTGTVDRNVDRFNQADQYNVGLANQNVDRFNSNRQIGAGLWDSERNRQSQAANQAINFENQGFNRFGQLMNVGDFQRGVTQQGLEQGYGDWQQQQNWERNNLNWMANLLSQAQGGIGGQATQTAPGYSVNPVAGLLGAASLYGSMQ